MIIFIFGEDNYSSQRRLIELEKKFREKYGELNFFKITFEKNQNAGLSSILSSIESVPFLSDKRMVVVKNLLSFADKKQKEIITQKLDKIPETSIVIFYEENNPQKNEKIYKKLLALSKVEEFKKISGLKLINWVSRQIVDRGAKIENVAQERLIYLVGADLFRLEQEIDKLATYCHPKIIKKDDVELLVSEKNEAKIFDLVDMLAYRKIDSALIALHRLVDNGEKDLYILSMINYGFRNLILVKHLFEQNPQINEGAIIKILNLHPFVAKKTAVSAKYFSFLELKKIYLKIIAANLALRSSEKNSKLTLDLLVNDICSR